MSYPSDVDIWEVWANSKNNTVSLILYFSNELSLKNFTRFFQVLWRIY